MANIKPYVGRFVLIFGLSFVMFFLILFLVSDPDETVLFRRVTLDTPDRKQWILITWPSMMSEVGMLIIGIGGLIHILTSQFKKRINNRSDRIGISLFLIGYSFDLTRTLYAYFLEQSGSDVFDLGLRWGGLVQPLYYIGLMMILRKDNPRIISLLITMGAVTLLLRNIPYILFVPHTSVMKCIAITAWFSVIFFIHVACIIGIIISIIGDRIRKRKEIGFY